MEFKGKMYKSKGITLIALIITIIVLLILAGVTINALTGSDSAPAKANEAGQKNDIGTAKDDISLTVLNAKTQGMETAYVGTDVTAENAKNAVGRAVISAVEQKYATNNQVGKATVTVDVEKTNNVISDDATISITTTDFEVEGTITLSDGILTWDEIIPNTPRIQLNKKDIALAPGGTYTLSVKFKQLEETAIEWTSSNTNVATVANGVVTIKTTANDDDTTIITAKATYGDKIYAATCNVLVAQVSTPATQALINTPTMIGSDVMNYTANNVSDWQVFYATENEVFIISKDTLEKNTSLKQNNIKTDTAYSGSNSVAQMEYGSTWNKEWLKQCATSENTSLSAKNTAYLCDTNNWDIYVVSPANYAVGAPTMELLLKSVEIKNPNCISNTLEITSNGYKVPFSGNIDLPYNNSWGWHIASPTGINYYNNGWIIRVLSNGVVWDGDWTANSSTGIRPLVSIPMNKVKIIGNKVKIVP